MAIWTQKSALKLKNEIDNPTVVGYKSYMRKNNPASSILPTISDAEWEVMKVLWIKAPQTTNQVVEELGPRKAWKPKTIHTLLRRLVDKGALGIEKLGREFSYHPLVDAGHCQIAETKSFIGRVFDGEMAPFLTAFVQQEKLTHAEIEALKRILDGGKQS
jgi:BlaI family penicillinase repressor